MKRRTIRRLTSRALLPLLVGLLLSACAAANPAPSGMDSAPAGSPCNLAALTPAATWQRTANSLDGVLTLTNYTGQACALQGTPSLQLLGENGQALQVDSILSSNQVETEITLEPEASTAARFTWSNWCESDGPGSLSLRVRLTSHSGQLDVQVQDPNGRPMEDTPGCQDGSAPSTLSAEPFQSPAP